MSETSAGAHGHHLLTGLTLSNRRKLDGILAKFFFNFFRCPLIKDKKNNIAIFPFVTSPIGMQHSIYKNFPCGRQTATSIAIFFVEQAFFRNRKFYGLEN